MEAIVRLHGLGLDYHSAQGETRAVEEVSFAVYPGELVSLVGPSGCGKSTILSAIAGLLPPSRGRVELAEGIRVGYMLQKDHLLEWRTIFRNACLGLEIAKKLNDATKQEVWALLEKYGLADFAFRKPSELSGGMRQRAALIRTLALKPDVLLLDEPFSALDYQTRLHAADEVTGIIRSEQKTAILVTHDISEAIACSDRVLVLSKRPAVLKNTYPIQLDGAKTPFQARESADFHCYFNQIWKDLDYHE